MKIQQKCRWCKVNIQAEGQTAFGIKASEHIRKYHYKGYKEIVMDIHNANEEFQELMAKYPKLSFFKGRFWIDTKKVLREGLVE